MELSTTDTRKIKAFYQDLLKQHGTQSPKSLGWINADTQLIRFTVLSEIGNLENSTILDVGCGLGDFYGFLKKHVKNFKYIGIDLVPEMIEGAKQQYPDQDFRVLDFSQGIKEKFDWIFASGVLNFKVKDQNTYFDMIENVFGLCIKGLAFNALDSTYHEDGRVYQSYSPSLMYNFCSSLTSNLTLRHDYLKHDFTVYLLRDYLI